MITNANLAISKSRELVQFYPARPAHTFFRTIELVEYIEMHFDEPVVDLGCGEGRFAAVLFGEDKVRLVGVDLSLSDLRKAKELGIYDSVVLSDVRVLPIRDNTVATFLSNSVLEHVPHFESAVREVARCLRPGGAFYSTFVTENILLGLVVVPRERVWGLKTKIETSIVGIFNRLYSLRQENFITGQCYCLTLTKAGFRVIRTKDLLSKRALLVWHFLHGVTLIAQLILAMGGSSYAITRGSVAWGLNHAFQKPGSPSIANIFVHAEKVG